MLGATRRLGRRGVPTVDQVARAAGVSRATVYRLFRSRDELLARAGLRPDPDAADRSLRAAAALIEERGLHGFTFDDVAERARVSRATVYRLFPGRPALLKALLLGYSPLQPVVETFERLRDRPPDEVMPAVARAAVAVVDRNRGLLLSVLSDGARLDAEVLETLRFAVVRMAAVAVPYLAGQMAAGRLRRAHPTLAIQAFVGPLFVHVLTRPVLGALPLPGALPPLEETATELAGAWLRAFTP